MKPRPRNEERSRSWRTLVAPLLMLGIASTGCQPDGDPGQQRVPDLRRADGPKIRWDGAEWSPDGREWVRDARRRDSRLDGSILPDRMKGDPPLPDRAVADAADLGGPPPDGGPPDAALDAKAPDAPRPDARVPDVWGPCTSPKAYLNCKADTRGVKWCPIKVGCFIMGSPSNEPCRSAGPTGIMEVQHEVVLTHDFEMQQTEVTQGQYVAQMGTNRSLFNRCGADCPVEKVDWHEAAAYANALSAQARLPACYACTGVGALLTCTVAPAYAGQAIYECPGYRLPTEAEWEYAYRSGFGSTFFNGSIDPRFCTTCSSTGKDVSLDRIGWYCSNSMVTTHPVATKVANGWGITDMPGNVREWCHDNYYTYPTARVVDPVETSGGYRAVRGGSWDDPSKDARAAARMWDMPGGGGSQTGIRIVRTIP